MLRDNGSLHHSLLKLHPLHSLCQVGTHGRGHTNSRPRHPLAGFTHRFIMHLFMDLQQPHRCRLLFLLLFLYQRAALGLLNKEVDQMIIGSQLIL